MRNENKYNPYLKVSHIDAISSHFLSTMGDVEGRLEGGSNILLVGIRGLKVIASDVEGSENVAGRELLALIGRDSRGTG
jgi:hypothetical protein